MQLTSFTGSWIPCHEQNNERRAGKYRGRKVGMDLPSLALIYPEIHPKRINDIRKSGGGTPLLEEFYENAS